MATDNEFFARFARYGKNGALDEKKSAEEFLAACRDWQKVSDEMKPIVLSEIAEYKRLGASTLVPFVLHRLHLAVTQENSERVESAIKELETSGKIVRQVNAEGSLKGRNAGYMIAGTQPAAPQANGSATA